MWMDANTMFYHSISSLYPELIIHQMKGTAFKYVIHLDIPIGKEHFNNVFKIQVKYIISLRTLSDVGAG